MVVVALLIVVWLAIVAAALGALAMAAHADAIAQGFDSEHGRTGDDTGESRRPIAV